MDVNHPLQLLGGLSPAQFMKRYWQKKPLLIKNAVPGFVPSVSRDELFDMAGDEGVESRLVAKDSKGAWTMKPGPFDRKSLPTPSKKAWSLLVQGVDSHHDDVRWVLEQFRFVPDARLDDLMISYASDGGGVGPHFDSYDVFLLQAHGTRVWNIGKQKDLTLVEGAPLKILRDFKPEEGFVLEPGDMLYLPPRYAHDGVARGECMTWSIGFRAPDADGLAREILLRMADEPEDDAVAVLYKDSDQPATASPADIPVRLQNFARQGLTALLSQPLALERALGEIMTEPKPNVWFEELDEANEEGEDTDTLPKNAAVRLDRRTRMMYDANHVFINGESYLASGKDATLMRKLADDRSLDAKEISKASEGARALMANWREAGWLKAV